MLFRFMLFSGQNKATTDVQSILSSIDMKRKSTAILKENIDRYENEPIDKKHRLIQIQRNIDVFHEEMDSLTQQIQSYHMDPKREGWKSTRKSTTLKWKSEKDDWLNLFKSICTSHERMYAESKEHNVLLLDITELQADVKRAMKNTPVQSRHPGMIVEKPGLQTS